MAVAHKEYPIYGVQFHPESILAEMGVNILSNFLTNVVGVKVEGAVPAIPMDKRTSLKSTSPWQLTARISLRTRLTAP